MTNMIEKNRAVLEITNLIAWHNSGYTGKGVTIAVIDNFEMDKVIMPYNHNLPVSHGLNVCKSARVTAPDANIMMLKWKGQGSDKQRCIDWINANKSHLINISLGGIYLQAKDFEKLEEHPLFCATGNNAKDIPDYPARFNFALAVGSWNHNLNKVASYSNRGEDIFGLNPYIKNSQGNWWTPMGTSFATPFATGLAACYVQLLLEQGVKPKQELVYDFAKQNRNAYGVFVLPNEIPKIKEDNPMKIVLQIGKNEATVDGEKVSLDAPPVLQNGRTMVPLRFIAESLGCKVEWDGKKQKVIITR